MYLPLDYESFDAFSLTLTGSERTQAYETYYRSVPHTVYRYLSRPNPWMATNASYVYVDTDSQGNSSRYSTFEEYIPLITLLYLAASDKRFNDTKGVSTQDRVELFFKALALIGRAHNWDRFRTKDDGTQEQYDDMEGDKPSCYSGVKRRLFQSLHQHPLLTPITGDQLARAWGSRVYQYCSSPHENRSTFC